MKTLILTLLLALVLGGCVGIFLDMETLRGFGVRISESRSIPVVSRVDCSLAANITIKRSTVPSLSIRAQGNLLPYIHTNVTNGKLTVTTHSFTLRTDSLIAIELSVPDLDEFSLSGAGAINSELPIEKINISGTGEISCIGETDQVYATLSGAGNINLLGMRVKTADVHVSGAGNIRVNATEQLDVSISGIGNVYYMGNPSIHQSINGIGRVTKLN
jgi:hypothetical protein